MLRVIAGNARGRALKSFKGPGVRPATGRVREAWFNIIGPRVIDARFLDLYAGTGAMGIEALSRDAKRSVFVEKSAQGAKIIRENLGILNDLPADAADVRQTDALAAIPWLDRTGEQFDLVFVDPPYADVDAPAKVLAALAATTRLLAEGALVTIRHPKRVSLPETAGRLHRADERVYGDAVLSMYSN